MFKTKLAIAFLASASATLAVPGALALDGEQLYKTKTCAACHGKDGNTPMMPSYPKIAGQNAAYAVQQMQDIKSGARANGNSAAMKGVMHLVSDEEIEAIAAWLATLE
ncbi:cytochrome c [Pseudohaliea sp.]|uniref:c-type cytochrome n=1 Tax=Pseudohaliea sp. TaxID=2740289 RepID=UPI0032EEFDF2